MAAERTNVLLKRISEIQPEKTEDYSELGFATLYSKLYFKELIYNTTLGKWMFYDGMRWCVDEGGIQAATRAMELHDLLKIYGSKVLDDNFLRYVLTYGSLRKRVALVKDAQILMAKTQNSFDRNTSLFNCYNGTLDLDDDGMISFRDHSYKDMLTKMSGCYYFPDCKEGQWTEFLMQVMQSDWDMVNYLQRLCGYFLTAETSLDTAFFLYGATTRNGKSTFTETFCKMMGDYAAVVPPETLALSKNHTSGDTATPQLARLANIRFLNMSEPPKRMLLNAALFKSLTGGEKITARKLYQEPFEYVPQFKICINCNSLPVVTDDTLFQSDRVRIITFDRHFEPQEQNKNLKQELSDPNVLASVLNWAIEGLIAFREGGEQPPQKVLASTRRYASESDKIQRFLNDCLESNPKKNASGTVAHKKYIEWCNNNGYSADGKSVFFSSLRSKGLLKEHGTVDGTTQRNVISGYEILSDV